MQYEIEIDDLTTATQITATRGTLEEAILHACLIVHMDPSTIARCYEHFSAGHVLFVYERGFKTCIITRIDE